MNTLTYLKTIDSLIKTTTLFSQNPLILHSKKDVIEGFYESFGEMVKNFRAGMAKLWGKIEEELVGFETRGQGSFINPSQEMRYIKNKFLENPEKK